MAGEREDFNAPACAQALGEEETGWLAAQAKIVEGIRQRQICERKAIRPLSRTNK
jgi:hypothetical protein